MAAPAKKKNKKGKTISLTDFLVENGELVEEAPMSLNQSAGLMKLITCKEMVQPFGTVLMTMCIWLLQLTILSCPLLPGLLRKPISSRPIFLNWHPHCFSRKCSLSCDRRHRLNISAVHSPYEPSNPERLKDWVMLNLRTWVGIACSVPWASNEESLGNRRIWVDLAAQTQDKSRNDHSSGGDRNQDSDKIDTHWRAHLATDSFDAYLPRRGDDSFGDKCKIIMILANIIMGIGMWYHDGPHHDMDWYGGWDHCDDWSSRDYDRGNDSRIGSGRRTFGSGYHRDGVYRGGRDQYEDRYDRRDDWSWSSSNNYSQDDYRHVDRGVPNKPRLKPWSTSKEDGSSASTSQTIWAACLWRVKDCWHKC